MTYSSYSTDSADYYQVHTHHGSAHSNDVGFLRGLAKDIGKKAYPTMEEIFEKEKISDLDGIVLENWDASDDPRLLNNSSQYKMILENIFKSGTKIPVYFLDVLVKSDYQKMHYIAGVFGSTFLLTGAGLGTYAYVKKKKIEKKGTEEEKMISRRKFMKAGILSGVYTGLGLYMLGGHLVWPYRLGFRRGKADRLSQYMIYLETELFPTMTINLRNAIWAKKIEKVVAPRLAKKLGRKPRIAIVSGVMHAGLQQYLQDWEKRDRVIEKYEKELWKIKEKDLNGVLELMPVDEKGSRSWKPTYLKMDFWS